MGTQAARRVSEYVLDRIDDGLRTVSVIENGGIDLVFLRDDLRAEYDSDRYERVAGFFGEMPAIEDARLIDEPIGQREALLHAHENAFVLQLPADGASIIVSVEPAIGRDLLGFIEECRRLAQ